MQNSILNLLVNERGKTKKKSRVKLECEWERVEESGHHFRTHTHNGHGMTIERARTQNQLKIITTALNTHRTEQDKEQKNMTTLRNIIR